MGSFHLHMRRNWRKTGIAVAEECFLEYWNSYIQLGFSWFFLCLLVLFLQPILLHPCTCPKVILSVFSIWKQELRGNKKDNRMYQLSFKVVGVFFFFFNIIIILVKATFIILISFHFLNIPRNQTEYKRFYIGNFNEQHYKTLKPNLATETAATWRGWVTPMIPDLV